MKNVTIRSLGGHPWEVTVFPSGQPGSTEQKWYTSVNINSYIWRSFNLKDIMMHTGFIDKDTETAIKEAEGVISGHAIVGLGKNNEIKKNQMIVLEVKTGPNLYPVSAEVKIMGDEAKSETPWDGWPEPFIFKPALEFDSEGILKNPDKPRYCYGAYHIIGYLTFDPASQGKLISFDEKTNQYFVQVLKNDLLMNAFNYEGIPVAYGIPFHRPYLDFDEKNLQQ